MVDRAASNWRGVGKVRDTLRADRDEIWTPRDFRKCKGYLTRAEKYGHEKIVSLAESTDLVWSSELNARVTWFQTMKPPWNTMERMQLADHIARNPRVFKLTWQQRREMQAQHVARVTYGPSAPFEEWNKKVTPLAEHPATAMAQQALEAAAAEDNVQTQELRKATRLPRQTRVGRPAIPRAPKANSASQDVARGSNRHVHFPPAGNNPQPAMVWQARDGEPYRDPPPPPPIRGSASQDVARGSNWQPQQWFEFEEEAPQRETRRTWREDEWRGGDYPDRNSNRNWQDDRERDRDRERQRDHQRWGRDPTSREQYPVDENTGRLDYSRRSSTRDQREDDRYEQERRRPTRDRWEEDRRPWNSPANPRDSRDRRNRR